MTAATIPGLDNAPTKHAGLLAWVREIAELKMKDLNAVDLEGAMRQIEGTARSLGLQVVD